MSSQQAPGDFSGMMQNMLDKISQRVQDAGVFEQVERVDQSLSCRAMYVESNTYYQVHVTDTGRAWVGLYTPDRWLSESIEAQLMHQGDNLEELLEEELIDQGYETQLPVEHFRDEKKQYVFRSPVSLSQEGQEMVTQTNDLAVDRLSCVLLAYEAAFRPLGDMSPADE